MSKRVSYIITDNNITVNYAGQTHIVPRKDTLAERLIVAIRSKNFDEIPRLVSVAKRVEEFGKGNFKVDNGRIMVNGQYAPEVLSRKILRFMNDGLPVEPLIKFAENLLKNPSYRPVNELFQFLEKNDHPITDNGCFIAYKKVRDDFKDVHSGTFDNSVGNVVEVSRNQVDEDSTRTCSNGLHVANWDYAQHFYSGGLMLEVEVNPADVVAIPVDYNQSKMRVCRYTVLSVVDREHSTETALRTTAAPTVQSEDTCIDGCWHDDTDMGESEDETCSECGDYLADDEKELCYDCRLDAEEAEEERECSECGEVLCDDEDDVCCYCEDELAAEKETKEDRYPWEDELEEDEF